MYSRLSFNVFTYIYIYIPITDNCLTNIFHTLLGLQNNTDPLPTDTIAAPGSPVCRIAGKATEHQKIKEVPTLDPETTVHHLF